MFNYQINKAGTQNATMLCLLEFIPEEFIAELLATNALKLSVNSIGFNNLEITEPVPYEFYSGYFEKGTEEIETDMKQTDNGPIHTTELSFFLPNDTSDQTHILNRISEHRFILKYTDRNGEIKLKTLSLKWFLVFPHPGFRLHPNPTTFHSVRGGKV